MSAELGASNRQGVRPEGLALAEGPLRTAAEFREHLGPDERWFWRALYVRLLRHKRHDVEVRDSILTRVRPPVARFTYRTDIAQPYGHRGQMSSMLWATLSNAYALLRQSPADFPRTLRGFGRRAVMSSCSRQRSDLWLYPRGAGRARTCDRRIMSPLQADLLTCALEPIPSSTCRFVSQPDAPGLIVSRTLDDSLVTHVGRDPRMHSPLCGSAPFVVGNRFAGAAAATSVVCSWRGTVATRTSPRS